ncbi:hypothetical protein Cob_v007106 [Colletotrichum orbiculare MAFF 240422]|uniref:Uncharacterized protein n=1 Tax=Colletotrichum orbiculare (strain 104-T / ATCC 96160 / CBS 514.97 / LARS 414 / MAFF 240422) TaxID=1213857 RepID=A0A484FQQ2_COLOR|nr:hypothetical protein Cob_v007106 [Colletotrichum orbiculare MAFF 240422]
MISDPLSEPTDLRRYEKVANTTNFLQDQIDDNNDDFVVWTEFLARLFELKIENRYARERLSHMQPSNY